MDQKLKNQRKRQSRRLENKTHEKNIIQSDEDLNGLYSLSSIEANADDNNDGNEEAECIPNGYKSIKCFICGEEMTKIYKLRAHMQQHLNGENYNEKQLETSAVYELLNPHKRNIEASIVRNFLIDEIQAKRVSQFYGILTEAGIELHHSDSETDSETELDNNKNTDNVAVKIDKEIPNNIYECDLCEMTFDRRYKALFHQKTSHPNPKTLRIVCDYCGRRFCGVRLLIHHLRTQCESDEYPISCVERFRQHLLKVNLEQFKCLAEARQDIKTHRLTTAEKVFSCNICQKSFLRSEHLTRHKAVHLPEELKMECPICFKKFNRKDNLRTHMKVHMNEPDTTTSTNQSILCQYCGHCFTSKSNYIVHMRRHTGEKPYVCEVCGKGFPKSTDLNSHKITHTGKRDFVCEICKRAFARQGVLSKHMRVHTGPYHCTYCDQSFQHPNELAQHLRAHATTTVRQYNCKKCKKQFDTKEEYGKHSHMEGENNEMQSLGNDKKVVITKDENNTRVANCCVSEQPLAINSIETKKAIETKTQNTSLIWDVN